MPVRAKENSLSERFAEMAKRHGLTDSDSATPEEFALEAMDLLLRTAERAGWDPKDGHFPADFVSAVVADTGQNIRMEGPHHVWTEDSVRGALVKIREAVYRTHLKALAIEEMLPRDEESSLLLSNEIGMEAFCATENLERAIARFTDTGAEPNRPARWQKYLYPDKPKKPAPAEVAP